MSESEKARLISRRRRFSLSGDEETFDQLDYNQKFIFVVLFVLAGVFMAYFTMHLVYNLVYNLVSKSSIRPDIIDEKCFFIMHANYEHPSKRMKKTIGDENQWNAFRKNYITLTGNRRSFYQVDPQKILGVIHLIAGFIMIFRFFSKKSPYPIGYSCLFDSYLFGLALVLVIKLLECLWYYHYYYQQDCFQKFF